MWQEMDALDARSLERLLLDCRGMGAEDTTLKELAAKRAAPRSWTLRILFTPGPPDERAPQRLLGGATSIGRAADCTLSLPDDPRMSRRHATITVDHGGAKVRDASANGTFVNGHAVEEARLEDGDLVRVGDSFLLARHRPLADPAPRVHEDLLGDSPGMEDLRRGVALCGPTSAEVLVVGETGTGKELVARALHALSRPGGPFVAVNCSAIPATLAEAALFGHVRGAFSGADSAQPGYFRAASGGLLFLDEVGELAAELQPKLLRALEERAVTPVGDTHPIACDVRVVAATNRDLRADVEQGRFRGDLYARLAGITLRTPPLRERREDVLPILCRALGASPPALEAELVEALLLYGWPFNVRELLKVASELGMRGGGVTELGLDLVRERLERPASGSEPPAAVEGVPSREELLRLLDRCKGVVADVARMTGRSRKQVYRWISRYRIDVTEVRGAQGQGEDD
jgi:transcriptional regulator with AAA-type ATPase domain